MAKKQLFGIFSPILGLKQDFPTVLLEKTYMSDNNKSHIQYGEVRRAKVAVDTLLDGSSVKVRTLDTYPILHYHRFVRRSDAKQYLLVFTKAHIYYWNESTKTLGSAIHTCASDCTEWHTVTFNNKVIATNNVDKVLEWSAGGNFVALDTHYPIITATTIAFVDGGAGEDTITDSGSGFVAAGFEAGDTFTVSGSTSNDGTYTIITVIAGTINIVTGSLATEAVGDTVTITSTTAHRNGINYGTQAAPQFLTKAKYVETFENYLFLGYTYEDGTSKPQFIRWSDLGDETDWNSGDAGGAYIGKRDFVVNIIRYKGFLIIFKEESIHKLWLTEASSDVFNNMPLSTKIGLKASYSVVMDDKDGLYFFASNCTFRHILLGEISQDIDPTVKGLKPSLIDGIRATFIDEYGEIWWAVPSGSSATANNKIIKYKRGIWNQEDIAVNTFGKYIKETDELFLSDLGADTSGYTVKLHDSEIGSNSSYFVLSTDLSDKKGLSYYKRVLDLDLYFNGKTYLTGSSVDADSASGQKVLNVTATGEFTVGEKIIINRGGAREEVGDIASIQAGVSITLDENLTYTHTGAQADVVEIVGKMTLYIKRDNETSWQNMGNVHLHGDEDVIIKHLPVRYRAKTFLIKVSSDDYYKFLGILFKSLIVGER